MLAHPGKIAREGEVSAMTFEGFLVADEAELLAETKKCFDRYNNPNLGGLDKPALLLEAQFYIQELGRREDAKVARRDFRMELIVILLIFLELIAAVGLAIWGSRQQTHDVNQQLAAWGKIQDVLSQLQTSSAATAKTMVSLQSTTQSVNERIGLQLGRMGQMLLEFHVNVEGNKTDIFNRGNVDLKLWGYKVSGQPARFYKNPIPLRRGDYAHPPTLLRDLLSAKGNGVISLDIYVRDDFGNDFIANTGWAGQKVTSSSGMLTLMESHWDTPK
jgi:hypothetical protein